MASLETARQRAQALQASIPRAVSARYDRPSHRVVVSLSSKLDLSFSPADVQGLQTARPSKLRRIEISPSGFGLHFPEIDADIYLPALLEGILGSSKWMASRLGAAGGRSTSAAKRNAARVNGRLGGRPAKARSAAAAKRP